MKSVKSQGHFGTNVHSQMGPSAAPSAFSRYEVNFEPKMAVLGLKLHKFGGAPPNCSHPRPPPANFGAETQDLHRAPLQNPAGVEPKVLGWRWYKTRRRGVKSWCQPHIWGQGCSNTWQRRTRESTGVQGDQHQQDQRASFWDEVDVFLGCNPVSFLCDGLLELLE